MLRLFSYYEDELEKSVDRTEVHQNSYSYTTCICLSLM